jgi:hypothetical protein
MTEFVVFVDDNFHYMDPDERRTLGVFASAEAALVAAKALVDASLNELSEPGMSARELYSRYEHFGDDPFIVGGGAERVSFSAWDYAKARSEEIAAGGKQP